MISKPRSSNIELLRIIAMLLIVQSHFAVHGFMTAVDGNLASIGNGLNSFFITAITTGNIGNALFMLITGYYLSQSHELIIKRLLRVVIQVFTYSVLCYAAYAVLVDHSLFSLNGVFTALTPLMHDTYWYFTCYVLVYLFHPFLNLLINHLNQKGLGILIAIMIVVWGFVPSILELSFESSGFLVFCFFYFIGAYIRRYYERGVGLVSNKNVPILDKNRIKLLLAGFIILWLLNALLTSKFTPFYRLVYMGSPLIIVLSIILFLFFLNIKLEGKDLLVNTIAGYMGGVYLLSDNPNIRSILYNDLFHVDRLLDSNYMIIYTLGFVLLVFVVCVIVESIRKYVYDCFEKLFPSVLNKRFSIIK